MSNSNPQNLQPATAQPATAQPATAQPATAQPATAQPTRAGSQSQHPSLQELGVAAIVGIDWADQKHDLCLLELPSSSQPDAASNLGSARYQEQTIEHTPETLSALVNGWRERFGGRPVAVAIEGSRGALIHHLMGYDFLLLYPINPSALDSYRKTFNSSGAKNDSSDAFLLCDLLQKHSEQYRVWQPQDGPTRQLDLLVRERRAAVEMQTALVQKLQSKLKDFFPQALSWAGTNLSSPMALDFLERFDTLEKVQRARQSTLRDFYHDHHVRREPLIEKRLHAIAHAQPLHQDAAIIETGQLAVAMLVGQLRALHTSITAYDKAIAEIFSKHPDAEIFRSFPGAGEQMAPRILAAFGADRARFEKPGEVQQFSGIAPVQKQSGKSRHTSRRYACSNFVRQTFHEFAGHSIAYSSWARAYYDQQKAKGANHHVALRALAFKWQRILWRCWQDQVPYDEEKYIQALRTRNSPLVAALSATN
jgi:transposase